MKYTPEVTVGYSFLNRVGYRSLLSSTNDSWLPILPKRNHLSWLPNSYNMLVAYQENRNHPWFRAAGTLKGIGFGVKKNVLIKYPFEFVEDSILHSP